MKLITEILDQKLSIIKEATEDGKKAYHIEGIFLMGDIKNKNGRTYPKQVLAKEVNRYNEQYIKTNRAYGELGHPAGPQINLDRVSHLIKELREDGSNYIGKAKITSTPMGDVVKGLLEDGANLGVSSRGMGTLKERNGIMEVQDDFMLATAADIVADPSAPNAFVRGILENVEYFYDPAKNTWIEEKLDDMKSSLKQMTKEEIETKKAKLFEQYCSMLSKLSSL